jgi:hypothetical protein
MGDQRSSGCIDPPADERQRAALIAFLGAGMYAPPSKALLVSALVSARHGVAMRQVRGLAIAATRSRVQPPGAGPRPSPRRLDLCPVRRAAGPAAPGSAGMPPRHAVRRQGGRAARAVAAGTPTWYSPAAIAPPAPTSSPAQTIAPAAAPSHAWPVPQRTGHHHPGTSHVWHRTATGQDHAGAPHVIGQTQTPAIQPLYVHSALAAVALARSAAVSCSDPSGPTHHDMPTGGPEIDRNSRQQRTA